MNFVLIISVFQSILMWTLKMPHNVWSLEEYALLLYGKVSLMKVDIEIH